VLSTFFPDRHGVDNSKFSQGLGKEVAHVIDRGTLILTYQAGDLGSILHSRPQYQWHTGLRPADGGGRPPNIGAVIARTRGIEEPGDAAFFNRASAVSNVGERRGAGKAFPIPPSFLAVNMVRSISLYPRSGSRGSASAEGMSALTVR